MENFFKPVFHVSPEKGRDQWSLAFILIILCLTLALVAVGCSSPMIELPERPKNTSIPTSTQETPMYPLAANTLVRPAASLTPAPTKTVQVSPTATDMLVILKNAVANLAGAESFKMDEHSTRAYNIFSPDGKNRLVFGEFHDHYQVSRAPALTIHCLGEYRYDPEGEFSHFESDTIQIGDVFQTRVIEPAGITTTETVDIKHVTPFSSDIFQTLLNYADQAEFVEENQGNAVYQLTHPAWYELQSAIGFADLGFLSMQEHSEERLKAYAADHYPGVKPILFTISVSMHDQHITRVTMDDRDFMISVWEENHRALVEQGIALEDLPRYQVLDVNKTVAVFDYE